MKEVWLLLKGSQTQERDLSSYADKNKQKLLIELYSRLERRLDKDLKTTADIMFTSPSAAAATIRQISSNGWQEWKDENGKPLNEYRSARTG